MTNVLDHLERLRAKPHHERKQIAVGVSLGISALIGVIWLGVSLSVGAFHVQDSSFAASTGAEAPATVVAGDNTTASENLAGAAAAVPSYAGSAPAIHIVDSPAPQATQPEATVIPF